MPDRRPAFPFPLDLLSRRGFLAASAAGAAVAALPPRAAAATTLADRVEQYGVTFRFSEPRPVGRYATGDWFVLGPVEIVAITPASVRTGAAEWLHRNRDSRTIHGAQLDWHGDDRRKQGLDDVIWAGNWNAFVPEANVDPGFTGRPLRLETPVTVIKAVSLPSDEIGQHLRPCLATQVFLTVVDEIPPQGAFRPAAEAGDKRAHWTLGDLDASILPSLPRPEGMRHVWDLAAMTRRNLRPHWNSHARYDMNRPMMARGNQPSYGREHAWMTGHAALALCTEGPEPARRALFAALVQQGLDLAAMVAAGQHIKASDGNAHGRALPLALAAAALGDAELRAAADGANFTASEHGQFFHVGDAEIGRPRLARDRPRGPYTEDMRGIPEFGGQHLRHRSGEPMQPERSGSHHEMDYRNIVSNPLVAAAAAAHAMRGVVEAWNQPAFFDYMDRWHAIIRYRTSGDAADLRVGNGPGEVAVACFTAWRNRSARPVHRARPEPMVRGRTDRNLRVTVMRGAPVLVPTLGGFEVHPRLNPHRDGSLDTASRYEIRLSRDARTWTPAGALDFGVAGGIGGLERGVRHYVQMRQVHPDHGAGPWSFDWVWWAENATFEGRWRVGDEDWSAAAEIGDGTAMFDWLAARHRREATEIQLRSRSPIRGREDRVSGWVKPFWLDPDRDFIPPHAASGKLQPNTAYPPSVVTL